MSRGKLGDDPAVSDAISAVANARNDSYLMQDAEAFIEDGIHPDDLPTNRQYMWPYPDERDGNRSYKSALKYVLRRYYDKNGYPGDDE